MGVEGGLGVAWGSWSGLFSAGGCWVEAGLGQGSAAGRERLNHHTPNKANPITNTVSKVSTPQNIIRLEPEAWGCFLAAT